MLVGGVEGVSDREVTERSAELGRRVAAIRTLQMSGAIIEFRQTASCNTSRVAVEILQRSIG
jgi:hypothetical protein